MPFFLASVLTALVVITAGGVLRSKSYATFRAVSFAVYVPIASAMATFVSGDDALLAVFAYLHLTVFAHSAALIRPRLRPLPYRALVSLPSAFFSGATLLALPWAVALAFGRSLGAPWLPYAVAAVGLLQSISARRSELDIEIDPSLTAANDGLMRWRHGARRVPRPLRIAQLTDPHLGPFMSEARLEGICERIVEKSPDLVLLTGDFLTMESQADPQALTRALAPLRELRGKVFACFGNHDHEAPKTVRAALHDIGATLLVDRAELVDTPAGKVQIVGLDFVWRNRQAHVERVCRDHPPVDGALRLLLLHDPGAFRYVPADDGCFVLSGHTHGGQVGLVSLGLPWTMLRLLMNAPDHGLWRRGKNLLYVHRGTGHYGFPLRVGVPAEESVLSLHRVERDAEPV